MQLWNKVMLRLLIFVGLIYAGLFFNPSSAFACSENIYYLTPQFIKIDANCQNSSDALAACQDLSQRHNYPNMCNYGGSPPRWQAGWLWWWWDTTKVPFTLGDYFFDTNIYDPDRNNSQTCPNPCIGDPVNVGTGNKFERRDEYVGGGVFPLRFSWTYNSLAVWKNFPTPLSILGRHRTHSYSWQLSFFLNEGSVPAVYLMRPDGQVIHFVQNGGGWTVDSDQAGILIASPAAGVSWEFDDEAGGKEWFDSNGRLVALFDASGNKQTLSYDSSGRLASVVDPNGRMLSFDYNSSNLVSVLHFPDGGQISFQYSVQNDLTNVGYFGGVGVEYRYDEAAYTAAAAQGLLTGVVDERNARYSTTTYGTNGFAKSTVLAGGVESHMAEYAPPSNSGDFSKSTVTLPLGASQQTEYTLIEGTVHPLTVTTTCAGCQSTETTYAYDSNGRLSSKLEGAELTQLSFDGRGLLTDQIQAANDSVAERSIHTDWHASFRVPTLRTITNASGALEAKTQWAYNTRGQTVARCEIDTGDTAAMAYTCSATTAPLVGVKVRRWVTTYCEQADVGAGSCPLVGLVTSMNGPRPAGDTGMAPGQDDVTTYTYYPTDDPTCISNGACPHRHGDLRKVTNALGQVTETIGYDKNGRVTRMKDANGTYTDFAYHPRGWLTDRVVRANADGAANTSLDAKTHIDYDAVGNVTQVTQPDGAFLAYTYDDAHRLIKITDKLANSIDYCPGGVGSADCLDAAGNRKIEQVKDPSGAITRSVRRQYDQLSRLQKTLNAANDPTFDATNGYDGNGNLVQSADGLNVVTRQTYDGLNRLVKTIQDYTGIDPATQGTETKYAYDTRDNLRSVTDPDLIETTYDYDGLNNLAGLHSHDTGDTGYQYDAAGNRVSQTDARGVTSTYTYDALNRLTAITYPTASLNVGYFYDQPNSVTGCASSYPLGRLTRMTDATGSTTYCYDRRGNVTRKLQQTAMTATCGTAGCGGSSMSPLASGPGEEGGGVMANLTTTTVQTLITQYGYSVADRLASLSYPSGAVVTYGRDIMGRINLVTWKANANASAVTIVANASYAPFGPLNTLTYGNGRVLTKAYDADYAIDSVTSSVAGGLNLDFGVDAMGNITGIRTPLPPPDSGTRLYDYDSLYRVKAVWSGGDRTTSVEAYTYSKTGDRLSAGLNGARAQIYTYDAGAHRLTNIAGIARTYDANGNTISGGLSYDDRNRLRGWNLVNGQIDLTGDSALYGYNGRGERVSKQGMQVCNAPACVPLPGGPSGWLTGTVAYSYDESGQLLSEAPGPYSTSVGGDTIYLDSLPVAVVRNGTVYALETDHLGTPRLAFNLATNATAWSWVLEGSAFGTHAPTGALTINLRFPGQYYDAETGLNYNYFRTYEPGTGRYTQSDPIGLRGGIGTYVYAANNPLGTFDASGLAPGDKWWEYTNRDFQRWYHQCWKIPGEPDASREELRDAYEEWKNRGMPKDGNCWGGGGQCPEPSPSPDPAPAPEPNLNFQPPKPSPWWLLIIILMGLNPVTA